MHIPFVYMYVNKKVHTYKQMYWYLLYIYVCMCMKTYSCACMLTCICINENTQSTHTYICPYIHIHACTYIFIKPILCSRYSWENYENRCLLSIHIFHPIIICNSSLKSRKLHNVGNVFITSTFCSAKTFNDFIDYPTLNMMITNTLANVCTQERK